MGLYKKDKEIHVQPKKDSMGIIRLSIEECI